MLLLLFECGRSSQSFGSNRVINKEICQEQMLVWFLGFWEFESLYETQGLRVIVHMFGASSINQSFLFPSISPPLSIMAFSLEPALGVIHSWSSTAEQSGLPPISQPAPSCGIEFADAWMAVRVAPWAVLNYPQRGFGCYPVPLDWIFCL